MKALRPLRSPQKTTRHLYGSGSSGASLIIDALSGLPEGLPILSEESEAISATRSGWQTYWLVDPLDGTKEFISRNGEFTVNIALIDNGIARAGVVHVPVSGFSYVGELGYGAWKIQPNGAAERIFPTTLQPDHQCLRIVASRSCLDELYSRLLRVCVSALRISKWLVWAVRSNFACWQGELISILDWRQPASGYRCGHAVLGQRAAMW